MARSTDLQRFIDAQNRDYSIALAEIRQGKKESHWMWYIFPQVRGLGLSDMAQRYAIHDLEEAKAFLEHPVLGQRLIEISNVLLESTTNDAYEVFGTPDNLKLKSSMTLFASVPNAGTVFQQVLDKFYNGERDKVTLNILGLH